MIRIAILLPLLVTVAVVSVGAQSPTYRLLDVVVFGAYLPVDSTGFIRLKPDSTDSSG